MNSSVEATSSASAISSPGVYPARSIALEQQRERLLVRREVGREATFVAQRGGQAALLQQRLERVVRLDPPPQRLGEARGADRGEHELLHVDVGVGVRAAVEHVHERHRQHVRVGAAHVAVERQLGLVGRGLRRGQRHAEDGVGAEAALAVGAVEGQQLVVEEALVGGVEADHGVGDLGVHVLDRGAHALAAVALAAVTQLVRLVGAGAGAARDDGPAARSRQELDVDLDGRVSPGIEDLAAHDLHDRAHVLPALLLSGPVATVADVTSEPTRPSEAESTDAGRLQSRSSRASPRIRIPSTPRSAPPTRCSGRRSGCGRCSGTTTPSGSCAIRR